MKKIYCLLFFLFTFPVIASGAEGSFIFGQGSGVYQINKQNTATLFIATGGEKINAADTLMKFNPSIIKINSISKDKSIFKLWAKEATFSNTKGEIVFSGGIPKNNYRGSAGEIFKINFTPLKPGVTSFVFSTTTSSILTADGYADNILKEVNNETITFGNYYTVTNNNSLIKKVSGKILLQVENKGRAWYVNPVDNRRYYLGRPDDAFNLMRKLGGGVNHKYITTYASSTFPRIMSGKILLDVEDFGKAYYINPTNLKSYYLGRPGDAFAVMRQLGIGINNANLFKIANWAI